MSISIATVSEGPCDYYVLQNIILGICKKHGIEVGSINPASPTLDATGKQQGNGGWGEVFRWIEAKKYDQALMHNDFVVFHIDTDACEEKGYAIEKTLNGKSRPPEELFQLVKSKMQDQIGEEDFSLYSDKFLFAIAVHSVECWLLPLWGREDEMSSVSTCFQRVNRGLKRANQPLLKKDDTLSYSQASSPYRKHKTLMRAAKIQRSLEIFVSSVSAACTRLNSPN